MTITKEGFEFDKNDVVLIPKWVVGLIVGLLPLIFSVVIAYGVSTANNAKQELRIQQTEEAVKIKASQESMDNLIKTVDALTVTVGRIENKVDSHMNKDKD